ILVLPGSPVARGGAAAAGKARRRRADLPPIARPGAKQRMGTGGPRRNVSSQGRRRREERDAEGVREGMARKSGGPGDRSPLIGGGTPALPCSTALHSALCDGVTIRPVQTWEP